MLCLGAEFPSEFPHEVLEPPQYDVAAVVSEICHSESLPSLQIPLRKLNFAHSTTLFALPNISTSFLKGCTKHG